MAEHSRRCSWFAGLPASFGPCERTERRDAREHRQRILEAARQLFTQYGVDAVSMHQIALRACVGQGTLYRRYAHKSELCQELLREQYQQFMTNITVFFADADAKKLSICEQLKGILAHAIAFLEEQGELLEATEARGCRIYYESDGCAKNHPSLFSWLYQVLVALLTEAMERGEFAPFDVAYTADALLVQINPQFYRRQRRENGFTPERILQGLYRIYIDGLRVQTFPMQGEDERDDNPTESIIHI